MLRFVSGDRADSWAPERSTISNGTGNHEGQGGHHNGHTDSLLADHALPTSPPGRKRGHGSEQQADEAHLGQGH
ncbi:MAG: hypothetical protein CM1200mP26_00960 [Acidimicrobiales bacterium]|nr:MAG: hypothetical protein CM1200mP26_00960 [Acidimicrobiales bacterium]